MSVRNALVQLASVTRKEVRQTVRDRRVMFMLIAAPLLQTIVFGYAIDFDVDRVPTAVVDHDRTAESRRHLRRLLADGTLTRVRDLADLGAAEALLETGEAAATIVLPPGLQGDLLAGRAAEVQVILDGTDPLRAQIASSTVARYFGEVGRTLMLEGVARAAAATAGASAGAAGAAAGGTSAGASGASAGSASAGSASAGSASAGSASAGAPRSLATGRAAPALIPRVLNNPSLRTPPFMIPGVLAMLLVIVTTIVTAMGLSREREMGTLEQVLVTPIKPLYLLIGKMTPFVVIGAVDVMLVLTVGAYLFDVPLRGSLGVLSAATFLYLLSTLGVGLLISTVSQSQQQAFLGGFLFAIPAILLSGVMTPIRSMPEWLQAFTYLNPVRYFVELLRAILLEGASLADVGRPLVALAVFGVALLGVAAMRFQKRVA